MHRAVKLIPCDNEGLPLSRSVCNACDYVWEAFVVKSIGRGSDHRMRRRNAKRQWSGPATHSDSASLNRPIWSIEILESRSNRKNREGLGGESEWSEGVSLMVQPM